MVIVTASPNSDRVRKRRGMFASAEPQAAWQIANLARGHDNAVPSFRVRSRWNKCDHSRPASAASCALESHRPIFFRLHKTVFHRPRPLMSGCR
jgi:hypothetical protein